MKKIFSALICAAAVISMPVAAQASPAESIQTGADRVNANFGNASGDSMTSTDNVPLIIAALLAGAAALFLIFDSNGDDAPVSP